MGIQMLSENTLSYALELVLRQLSVNCMTSVSALAVEMC